MSSLKSGFTGTRLILIGIGMAAILQAWTNFVLSKAPSYDLPTATRWITGSLNTMSWQRGLPLLVAVVVIAPVMVMLGHKLNVLRLGDDLAVGLGLRLNAVRVTAIVGAVILIAVATASTGPIAFVAFMAGPIATRLFHQGPSMIAPSWFLLRTWPDNTSSAPAIRSESSPVRSVPPSLSICLPVPTVRTPSPQ